MGTQISTLKTQDVRDKIYTIRGMSVMLDSDLAELYQVETRTLNQAVKRNSDRFPDGFMFHLILEEYDFLRSQFVILEDLGKGKHSKYLPYAFTEQGVAMLSGILKSKVAVATSIHIIQAFVQMRKFMQIMPSLFSE